MGSRSPEPFRDEQPGACSLQPGTTGVAQHFYLNSLKREEISWVAVFIECAILECKRVDCDATALPVQCKKAAPAAIPVKAVSMLVTTAGSSLLCKD